MKREGDTEDWGIPPRLGVGCQQDLSKEVTVELILKGEKEPGRGNSRCKDPGVWK